MKCIHYLPYSILFLPLIIPSTSGWSWLWKPKPFQLTQSEFDRCDFEDDDCEVTFFQLSDWYRGHEDKLLVWLRANVAGLPEHLRDPLPVNWMRANGFELPVGQIGPRIDHTTTSPFGHFMFLHPNLNDGHHVTVLLQSKEYKSSAPFICFRYSYVLTGDAHTMVALKVKDSTDREVYKLQLGCQIVGKNEEVYTWKEAECTIKVPRGKSFKVAIMGNVRDWRLGSPEDSIAVDDLEIRAGKCPTSDFLDIFARDHETIAIE